jgi:signal transduction histidine kinase
MPEAFRGYLRHIDTAAQRMQRLIEDIVRLARIGRAELRRSPTDLSAMAHEIIDGLRHDEPARNVEVSIADGLSADADVSLMRVALENLLGNAWKFSSKRSDARIAFGCDDQQVFSVSDNGVGFAMKDAERIFRGFQRLHGDKEFKGSGIGLSTAQRVIQRHGGRIWAKSEPGAGATFFFRLTPSA